ncbi:MAG: DNA polymerase III subunit alpha [Candidatus Liptonbacteria bacterium]|nr:DNA polymerase III subunit alpha [Candidatus Liptonbacteria bacterium]
MEKFVHLHTHSHYSLLDGLAKIDELVARTKALGMNALALTDHGVLYGAVEFYKKAVKAGVKPILGVEAYIATSDRKKKEPGERYYHLILLAENNEGWRNLIELVTKAHLEGFYYKPRMDKELLRAHHTGLIALSGCLGGEISRAILANRYDDAVAIAKEYETIFGKDNFFLEIGDHPHIPETITARNALVRISKETGIPLAATQDIHYAHPEDSEYHDILLAVQTGNRLTDDDRLTLKADDFSVTSPEQMIAKFRDVPEAIISTVKIAERCTVALDLHTIHLPDFPKPNNEPPDEYLRALVGTLIEFRYPGAARTKEVHERVEYELSIIKKTGFADYFLIVHDLVDWAKKRRIAVGPGRGSAAGSIVSYILHITDVDPLKYNLLFERFLNPDRIQMPDIDIDFADTRRDEVLAYAIEKYGADRVAQIITFGTMAARAAIRDAGRAMGLSYGFCDKIAKLIPFNLKLADAIKKVGELKELKENDENAAKLLEAAIHLEGVARHASVHACGTVISKEPLTRHVPLQFAPQGHDTVITQLEMHSIEDLGLLKIDLLGLKNLTIIEETVRLVKELSGKDIVISSLPLDDEKTFELLRRGDTTGVFQLESSGMRRYLKELKPTEFEDIVAMISLYRPGTLDAGMVPKYIARKHGKESVTYLYPKLKPILEKTYGIAVYQEQLMEIARTLAGFTFSEADTLRKAVGKKIKSLLNEQSEKLIDGMIRNGITPAKAREIWAWFEPFARYGFNRSHAVCYALIGYHTAYLKAHYPEEFMASLLNAELNDIERIAFLVHEAKQNSVPVLPPDVNASFVKFTPDGKKIRFGLLAIKNVGAQITNAIVEERVRGGPFKDFNDFLLRVQHKDLNKKSLESLIKCGVFDSLGVERNQALGSLDDIIRVNSIVRRNAAQNTSSLFGSSNGLGVNFKFQTATAASAQEKLAWEKELLGLFISDHPLNRFMHKLKELKVRSITEARAIKNERLQFRIGGLVSRIQRILTKKGDPMMFVKIEDFSPQPLEVVVFNSTLNKTMSTWKENQVVLVQGRMSWRDNEPKMICENAKALEES